MGKKARGGCIIPLGLLAIGAVGFYFTPHVAIYNMGKALEQGDAEALSQYVNYPSLRESLKSNLNTIMLREVSQSRNPLKAMGAVFGTVLINPIVDTFVTPEGLSLMMKGEQPELDSASPKTSRPARTPPSPEDPAQSNQKPDGPKQKTSMFYKDINHFSISTQNVETAENREPEKPFELIFERDGLMGWKLSAVQLP